MEVWGHTNSDGKGIRPQVLHRDWEVPHCHAESDRDGGAGKTGSRQMEVGEEEEKPNTDRVREWEIHI